jgi:spermidine synthase
LAETSLAWRRAVGSISGRALLPILLILFFASGVSALIYQVLWLRLLALVFGVTVWAVATTVASFMAGLALGSFSAGRLIDRARAPLLWFAGAEALVALSALATPWALGGAEAVYALLYRAFPDQLALLTVARFAVSMAVLIVPTTLMGATLPIVIRSSMLDQRGLSGRVGLLYGINTAGAVVGTLLAAFYLIGGIGIAASFQLAAAINLAVAVSAAAASRLPTEAAAAPTRAVDRPIPAVARASRTRRLVLAVFALSGFASMAQEVIWSRLLVFVQAVNVYAFAIMLAAFLTGIALGGLVAGALMRRPTHWLLVLAALELLIGAVSVASISALSLLGRVLPSLQARLPDPMWETLPAAVASFLVLMPITLLLGIAFPIGLRLWADDGTGDSGRRVGIFYAANVGGAILGAPFAGFVLLPLIGSYLSLILVALLSTIAGLALLVAARGRLTLAIGVAGLALLGAALAVARDPHLVILKFRYGGQEVLWREEGAQTTVSIHRMPDQSLAMFLDGHSQASDTGVGIHRMIGMLPMALHRAPTDILVVGLGGGATAGASAAYPGARVDVVELSGGVIRGAELFRHVNGDIHRRANVRWLVEDGRNHLLLSGKRYDAITADIVWPYHAGAGNLYAREYFALTRRSLTEEGLMVQWVGMLQETQHKLIVRTFLDVFPDATLWAGGAVLVGATRPLRIVEADLARKLDDPAARAALGSIGIGDLASLLRLYQAGPEELRRYAGPGPLLTDDRPMVEYFLTLPRGEPAGDLSAVRGDPRRHLIGAS